MVIMKQLSSHRFFVFGTLLTAAGLGALQLAFLDTSTRVITYNDDCHNVMSAPTDIPTAAIENITLLQKHGIEPRAFSIWQHDTPLPCFPPEKNWRFDLKVAKSPTQQGFLFCKGQKVGSSTGSGITLRIATNVARRSGISEEICKSRFHHTRASWMGYHDRIRDKSFLWTLVRDPTARSISDFFHFDISRKGVKLTDANFMKFLNKPELVNQQLDYISTRKKYPNQTKALQHVLNDYDFIGVTERMDESAVALSMILGVPLQDVIYLSHTKSQGSFDDGRWKNTCIRVQPSTISPNIRNYLTSEKWQKVIYWDTLLHQAANISLDFTIDMLGRAVFERNLRQFQQMKQDVMEYCSNKVVYPCNASGVPPLPIHDTDCIHGDLGCGFDCMDDYFGNVNTTMVHRQVINTTVLHKRVLNRTVFHKEIVNETVVYPNESAETIVQQAFNSSFGYLVQKCGKAHNFDWCCRNVKQGPWWFRTMMRDVPTEHVMAWWHIQAAPRVTSKDADLQMCAIEKVGIKHWKQLFCVLQNRTERLGGSACIPNATIAKDAPKFVFLRDPLERFLSAFINKCVETGNEDHCEPVLEHVKGLDKKTLFEAYVNAFPLKWNLHFFPQSVYCNGLYRQLDSYDFVGRMGPTFYQDLERLGQQFGGTLPGALEQVFRISNRLNNTNQGIETSASSHVLEYYTPKTLRQVLEYFAIDYELLDIPIPDWAQQMLQQQDGDDSVASQNHDRPIRVPNKVSGKLNLS